MFIVTATSRTFKGIGSLISTIAMFTYVLAWDFILVLLNLVSPKRKIGAVILANKPGHGGEWPEFIAPTKGDSRSPCPGLNALANHGIIARDGRNIPFVELNKAMRSTYNLAPTFCYLLPKSLAGFLTRSYSKSTVNLGDISVHNIIEHDASLTRYDTAFQPDQSKVAEDLTDELLAAASGKHGTLTASDISKVTDIRRRESRAKNGMYTMSFSHKLVNGANGALILNTFGGRVDDLAIILKEERLPENWEPRVRNPFGLTIGRLHQSVMHIELGVSTAN